MRTGRTLAIGPCMLLAWGLMARVAAADDLAPQQAPVIFPSSSASPISGDAGSPGSATSGTKPTTNNDALAELFDEFLPNPTSKTEEAQDRDRDPFPFNYDLNLADDDDLGRISAPGAGNGVQTTTKNTTTAEAAPTTHTTTVGPAATVRASTTPLPGTANNRNTTEQNSTSNATQTAGELPGAKQTNNTSYETSETADSKSPLQNSTSPVNTTKPTTPAAGNVNILTTPGPNTPHSTSPAADGGQNPASSSSSGGGEDSLKNKDVDDKETSTPFGGEGEDRTFWWLENSPTSQDLPGPHMTAGDMTASTDDTAWENDVNRSREVEELGELTGAMAATLIIIIIAGVLGIAIITGFYCIRAFCPGGLSLYGYGYRTLSDSDPLLGF